MRTKWRTIKKRTVQPTGISWRRGSRVASVAPFSRASFLAAPLLFSCFCFSFFCFFFSLHFPVPAPPVFFLRSRTRNFACAASLHLLCLAQHQKRTFIGLSWSSESLDSLDFAPVDRV